MKPQRVIPAVLLLALAGSYAFASEGVPWGHKDHLTQFKYLAESEIYTQDTWAELLPDLQDKELREAVEPAQQRLEAVQAYYEAAMAEWDSAQLRDYAARTTEEDLKTVRLWLGNAKAAAFANKLALVRAKLEKASEEGLTDAEAAALAPHLTDEAIAGLRSMKYAAAQQAQVSGSFKKHEVPKEVANAAIKNVSGALSGNVSANIAKVFDGNTATGDAGAVRLGEKYALPKGTVRGAVAGVSAQLGKQVSNSAASALGANQPRATVATTVKSAPPAALAGANPPQAKSSAWTSDAYGFTVTANGRTQTYRDQAQAEAAIRALPDGSVSKIVLYGHGSPGMQTVGPATYDSDSTAELLRGKMARGGVIQFSGCNTASIGGSTLNPAVGLSMITRRLLYFSLPYFQDRADGVPAAQAKEQWDKGWNADLARDTSRGVKGAVVCGYRTFGLVPGRLPGLTRLMGNQEATTPGYVAGKIACYQDGREVAAP